VSDLSPNKLDAGLAAAILVVIALLVVLSLNS
jgi:hypothetical protein